MSWARAVAAVCLSAALAACSIGQPIPQATTYVVEPAPPATAAPRRPEALRMGNVRVAPAFASEELVYRVDDVRFTPDFYNRFIADPGPMLGARMAQWLNQAGPFSSVTQPGGAAPAQYALEASVTELYGDFRANRKPAAVMSVQFTLIDVSGPVPQVMLERTIERRIELGTATPEALVRGYGSALGEILAELAPQLAR
jgi:uncharacterized lipoprotein YmbA